MFDNRNSVIFVGLMMGVVLLLGTVAAPAGAGQRVALVIGNADYAHAPALATPTHDASDITAALERLGFAVDHAENADQTALRRGIRAFATVTETAEVAVVFYAGHGVAVEEQNFLLPTDALLASEQDLEFEAVPLSLVERAVSRSKGFGVIILDASRENPFASSMREAGALRTIGRGLAKVEPLAGTLVAYAAKEGTVAPEGQGRNSLYSETLLRYLEEPGLEVEEMFRKVREAVLATTGGKQEPSVYGSLSNKSAHLRPLPTPSTEAPEVAQGKGQGADLDQLTAERLQAERLYWASVKDSSDPAEIQTYLDQYPTGTYAALARVRLERLKGEPEATSAPDAATPAVPVETGPTLEPEAAEAALGLRREDRRLIQAGLKALGFDPGPLDGLFGRGTRTAIGKWQVSEGKPATGYLDAPMARALAKAGAAAPPLPRDASKVQAGLSQPAEATLSMALQAAGKIDHAFTRANAFANIGNAFAQAGDARRAKQSLDLAMAAGERVEGLYNFVLGSVLSTVVATGAKLGDASWATHTITRVMTTAQRLKDADDRADVLTDIAKAQAEVGNAEGAAQSIQQALTAATEIEVEGDREWNFHRIAVGQAQTGDFRGALATAQRIKDNDAHAWTFARIAEVQAEAGETEGAAQSVQQALAVAAQIEDEDDRAWAFARIAKAQAKAGETEGAAQSVQQALAVAAQIEDEGLGDSPLKHISEAQAQMGDFRGALATAQRIKEDDARVYVLTDIAEAQTEAGDVVGAARLIQQALAIAQRIKEDDYRHVYRLTDIAEAQAQAGDVVGAARLIQQALATAQRIKEDDYRPRAFTSIARAQIKIGTR